MGRIDDALRRSAEGVAVATPDATDQRQFVSAWTDAESRAVASSMASAVVQPEDSIPVAEPDANLPGLNPIWRERLVSARECDPTMVGQFMRLAATLHKVQAANGLRIVMVTSPDASDGKTLAAINLALVLSASYRRRVLLIDADLRRPSLGEIVGVVRPNGLSQVLKAKGEQKLSVIPLTPTLTLLPGGTPDPDPIGGLTSERMRGILHDAAGRFDWVILDAPPVGPLADARLLSEMVDGTLLVIRAAHTQCVPAQKAIDALGRDRVLGVVLNAVDRSGVGQHGKYYGGYAGADRERGLRTPTRGT